MLLTPFRAFRIPKPYKSVSGKINVESYDLAVDIMAWLNGEEIDQRSYNEILNVVDLNLIAKWIDLGIKTVKSDTLDLVSNDDKIVTEPTLYLRRRFQLIDNHLSAFPGTKSIKLPFSAREISNSVHPNSDRSSILHTECLPYLNPKDPMYYFIRSTVSLSPSLITEWSSLLSEQQRTGLLEARRLNHDRNVWTVPMPNEGRGDVYLACIFEIHQDAENLLHFFPQYPSYLTLQCVVMWKYGFSFHHQGKIKSVLDDLLTKADYTKSKETQYIGHNERTLINDYIDVMLLSTNSKEVMKRLLSMKGIRSKLLENETSNISGPYSWYYDTNFVSSAIVANIASLFQLSIGEVESILPH